MAPTIDLSSLGWDDYFADQFHPYAGTHSPARVARVDRGAADVLTESGEHRAALRPEVDVTVGDWVALPVRDEGPLTIDAALPRRTAFVRGAASGTSTGHVLAANIDTVFATVPLTTAPKLGLVERLVALAWESGATPVVLLTKSDVADDAEVLRAEVEQAAPGVEVHTVSALTDDGLDAVTSYVGAGRTIALIGQSGVGKSTLVNRLLGSDLLATGDIRDDGKGRHTTTYRQMVPLPDGGVLIDTPGLRGVALWLTDDGDSLARTFADVEAFVDECRFGDCAHDTEPGCAVLAAVEDGLLPHRRLESWRKLRRELRWMESRTDARLRAEQKRAWKIVSQEYRRSGRSRP